MKKLLVLTTILFLIINSAWSKGVFEQEGPDYSEGRYKYEIAVQLGHDLTKAEDDVAIMCYVYYKGKYKNNWTPEQWNYSIERAVGIERNPFAIAAAKLGLSVQKFTKAFIVTAEEGLNSFQNWMDTKSKEYDQKNNS